MFVLHLAYINANYVIIYFNGNESLEENKNIYEIICYEFCMYVVYYIYAYIYLCHMHWFILL